MTYPEAQRQITDNLLSIYSQGEAAAIGALLLEHITGKRPQEWRSRDHMALTATQEQAIAPLLDRLLTHEPVQYVTGEAWFCGLRFSVNRHVLIPRPETEELVEWLISQCRFPIDTLSIADMGTGSGCIPIALKKRLSKADVRGYEISPDALEVARGNAAALDIPVRFEQLDMLDSDATASLPCFDFITSNPPYIPKKEKDSMPLNVTGYEPELALFVPDNDPLLFYKALATLGKSKLNPGGMLLLELHEDLAQQCDALFAREGYQTEIKKDMQGKERMLRAWH